MSLNCGKILDLLIWPRGNSVIGGAGIALENRVKPLFFFAGLDCPICKKTLCWHGKSCQRHRCWAHHVEEHDNEKGNELVDYLISDYSDAGVFSSSELLRICGLLEDRNINKLISKHILEISKSGISDIGNEYLEKLTAVGHLLDIEHEVLSKLREKSPNSHWWDYSESIAYLKNTHEVSNRISLVEMPNQSSAEGIAQFRKLIQDGIHKEFQYSIREILEGMISSDLKFGYVGIEIMEQLLEAMGKFGLPRQLATIFEYRSRRPELSPIVNDFDGWLVSAWAGILRSGGEKSTFAMGGENLLKDLEELSSLAEEIGDLGSLFFVNSLIEKRYKLGRETGSLGKERKMRILRGNLRYWKDSKELSNYIHNLKRLLNLVSETEGLEIEEEDAEIPSWVSERLIKFPDLIHSFEKLCQRMDVEFDFSDISSNLPKDSFSNYLFFKHHPYLIQIGRDQIPSGDDYETRLISSGVETQKKTKSWKYRIETPVGNPIGFTLDLPNLIWLDPEAMKRRCVDHIIEWINCLKVPCFIHSTPHSCHAFDWAINKIHDETDASFLFSDFSLRIDEDLHFLPFSLINNTWIVSNDGFSDSGLIKRFEPETYNRIINSLLFPRLSIDGGMEISLWRTHFPADY